MSHLYYITVDNVFLWHEPVLKLVKIKTLYNNTVNYLNTTKRIVYVCIEK